MYGCMEISERSLKRDTINKMELNTKYTHPTKQHGQILYDHALLKIKTK